MFKKSELIEVNKQLKRTGVLKSALGAKEGRRDKWTKQAEYDLKEAEKKLREKKKQKKN